MQKKIPQRQCVACKGHFDKKELCRIVKTPEGEIILDKTGKANGRGAYLCLSKECFKKAVKSNALGRALGCQIDPLVIEGLEKQIGGENAG